MIMASSPDSLLQHESTAEAVFRCGLFHPFGVSFLVIVEKVCTRAQHLDGPIGSLTRKIATFVTSAFPFIYAVQYQWLILLSFVDDHIQVIANILRTIFPPSRGLFKKIDRLVDSAEILPEKFDDAMNKLPIIIHRFPFLDYVSTSCIAWMNFMISKLWRSSNDAWEKEIRVDINCENCNNESLGDDHFKNLERPMVVNSDETKPVEEIDSSGQCEELMIPKSDFLEEEVKTLGLTVMRSSYKEIVEKGKNENIGKNEDYMAEEISKANFSMEEGEEKDGNRSEENMVSEDPIFELFEASWHMNPPRGSPSSFSFT